MLDVRDVCLSLDDKCVFEKGNLSVKKGEILVVTGSSGSGKSSFLRCLNGIVPQVTGGKVSGSIFLDGENIMAQSVEDRSLFLSTVFQNPKTQFFCVETTDEMAFGLENRNVPREEILAIMEEKMTEIETSHLAGRQIFTLSGGEKQLVAITATICLENRVYLFDEPTASLDARRIQWLKKMLLLLKRQGKIVIVAEHRLYFLTDILDRLCVIENGHFHLWEKAALKGREEEFRERFRLRRFDEKGFQGNVEEIDVCAGRRWDSVPREGLFCKGFRYKALLDMEMHFLPGIHFITGDNGTGKTTFLRILAGVSKGKGTVYFHGQRMKRPQSILAAVMQEAESQIFTDSVMAEVSIASDGGAEEAETVLESLCLLEKRDLHPQVLSGGEKQRLLLGRAFLSRKPVVLLDEPSSGLCRRQMENMCQCLKAMAEEGRIVIVVTHDVELINTCGGRVYRFKRKGVEKRCPTD